MKGKMEGEGDHVFVIEGNLMVVQRDNLVSIYDRGDGFVGEVGERVVHEEDRQLVREDLKEKDPLVTFVLRSALGGATLAQCFLDAGIAAQHGVAPLMSYLRRREALSGGEWEG